MDEIARDALPFAALDEAELNELLNPRVPVQLVLREREAVDHHPMDAYNVQDFRDIMGHKAGFLVRFGSREDYKTRIAECLAKFHDKNLLDPARRLALAELVTHANGWRAMYGGKSTTSELSAEKELKDRYLVNLISAAEEERAKEVLGTPAGSDSWITERLSQPPLRKLFAFCEEGWSTANDVMEDVDEGLEAHRVFANAAVESHGSCWDNFNSAARDLHANLSLSWDDASHGFHGLLGCMCDILHFLDFIGIGQLIRCANYLTEFAVAYFRRQYFAAIAEETKDKGEHLAIRKVALYALGKLRSKITSSIFLAVSSFARGLSRLLTILSAGTAAVVTESINLSFMILSGIHDLGRNLKGVYKTIVGTKGVARTHHAQVLMRQIASSSTSISDYAMEVFEGFFRASYAYTDFDVDFGEDWQIARLKKIKGATKFTAAASAVAAFWSPISTAIWARVVAEFFGTKEKYEDTRRIIRSFFRMDPNDIKSIRGGAFHNEGQNYDLQSIYLVDRIARNTELLDKYALSSLDVRKVQALFLFTFGSLGSRPTGGGWGPLELKAIEWLDTLANGALAGMAVGAVAVGGAAVAGVAARESSTARRP